MPVSLHGYRFTGQTLFLMPNSVQAN